MNNNNNNKSPDQEVKKELPDKNIEHYSQPEKVELKEDNQSNFQSCNDIKNKI